MLLRMDVAMNAIKIMALTTSMLFYSTYAKALPCEDDALRYPYLVNLLAQGSNLVIASCGFDIKAKYAYCSKAGSEARHVAKYKRYLIPKPCKLQATFKLDDNSSVILRLTFDATNLLGDFKYRLKDGKSSYGVVSGSKVETLPRSQQ